MVTGCAVALIGIGAAAVGSVAYNNGKLIKTYQAEYNAAVKASSDTLQDFKIPLKVKTSDDLKTVLKAERPDGTPVEIEVVNMGRDLTEVAVRTGVIGVWDKRVSEQIQDSINNRLSSTARKASNHTPDLKAHDIKPLNNETTPQTGVTGESHEESVSSIQKKSAAAQENRKDIKTSLERNPDFVIYFNDNTNELSEDAIEKLNAVAAVIINDSVAGAKINGFSDSTGSASFNKMVSESRANTAKIYLIGKGVDPSKIIAEGFGSDSPIVRNNHEEGRKSDGRVEIKLINP